MYTEIAVSMVNLQQLGVRGLAIIRATLLRFTHQRSLEYDIFFGYMNSGSPALISHRRVSLA